MALPDLLRGAQPPFTERKNGLGLRKNRELPYDSERSLALFDKITNSVPHQVRESSRLLVEKAFGDLLAKPERLRGRADSAFLIHTRRFPQNDGLGLPPSHPALDDAGMCFPALSLRYGIPDKAVEEFWETLPPFQAGTIGGFMPDGTPVTTALISVPITPTGLFASVHDGIAGPRNYALPRIRAAVDLANKFGAQEGFIGLGETLASLTNHGRILLQEYPDNDFNTGHAFTTLMIQRWVEEAARLKERDLADLKITILGAAGAIGRATLGFLVDKGIDPSHIILYDKLGAEDRILRNLREFGLDERGATILTGDMFGMDGKLKQACGDADLLVSGMSTPFPIVKAEYLKRGASYIDDSMPPTLTREEADKADVSVFWVVGRLPDGMIRDLDYGLKGNTGEWGCAAETVAMTTLKKRGQKGVLDTVGPVTPERVTIAGKIADEMGIGLGEPQSYGLPTSVSTGGTLVEFSA